MQDSCPIQAFVQWDFFFGTEEVIDFHGCLKFTNMPLIQDNLIKEAIRGLLLYFSDIRGPSKKIPHVLDGHYPNI